MLLFRTSCRTDEDGRPNHSLLQVCRAQSKEEARTAMDADLKSWMVTDIIQDMLNLYMEGIDTPEDWIEEEGPPEGWEEKQRQELLAKPAEEIKQMWLNGTTTDSMPLVRLEVENGGKFERLFSDGSQGEWHTVVYHLWHTHEPMDRAIPVLRSRA